MNSGYVIGGMWIVIVAVIMVATVANEERSRLLIIGVSIFGLCVALFGLSMLLAGFGLLPVR